MSRVMWNIPFSAHVPAKAWSGLDPGWVPVRRQERVPPKATKVRPVPGGTGRTLVRALAVGGCLAAIGGCSAVDRLRQIGEPPPLTQIENPVAQPGYKPVQMPMPTPQPAVYNPNSLWRNGSRAFFKDQRAMQIGDIMTVKVKFTDNAKIENGTARSRSSKEDSGVTDFIGSKLLTGQAAQIMPGKILKIGRAHV